MIMDVIIYGMRRAGFIPLVNMWCAQTVKPRTLIAMLEIAIA
jgi:hypothetical protein